MDACISYSKLEGYEAQPTLFFEFHGTEAGVREQARDDAGDRRRARRQRIPVGDAARGPHAAVEGAPQRLLRRAGAVARASRRSPPTPACRSRASPIACSKRSADARRDRPDRAHRRPRRRRQFPRARAVRPDERRPSARRPTTSRKRVQHARDRDGRHLHRRARHRHAQARGARRRARRGGRPHADDQARARSAQHHESRQDGST